MMDFLHLLFLFRSHRFFLFEMKEEERWSPYTHTHIHFCNNDCITFNYTRVSYLASALEMFILEFRTPNVDTERERESVWARARLDHRLNLHILMLIFRCFSMTWWGVSQDLGDFSNILFSINKVVLKIRCRVFAKAGSFHELVKMIDEFLEQKSNERRRQSVWNAVTKSAFLVSLDVLNRWWDSQQVDIFVKSQR